ncbi:O-antigen ligase family protein [Candidatus Peregrinibacteria bacterium]|nr:O-antigen ligase family protein [Candidatus Peregrinibacteria bacterium]
MQSLKKYLTIENALFCCLLGFVVVIPFIFNREVNSVFVMPKLFALRIITLLSILLWTYKIWKENIWSFIKTRFNQYVLLYGVVSIITTVFSVQIWASILGDYGRFIGIFTVLNLLFLSFLALNVIQKESHLKILIIFSIVTAFLLSLYGLMQGYSDASISRFGEFFQKIVGDPQRWSQDPLKRVFGTLGHSNHFGAYLAFNAMLGLSFIFTTKKWWQRAVLLVMFVTMVAALLASASRGALGAFLVGILVFGIFFLRMNWQKIKKVSIVIIIVISVLFIGAFFLRKPLIEKASNLTLVKRTIENIQYIRQGNIPDRISWWLSSFEMFKDRPILGQGLSTYKDVFNAYRRTDYRVPYDIQDEITPESAHMEYINTLATQGVVGLLTYLMMIGYVVMALIKFVGKNNEEMDGRWIALGILTAIITHLTQVLLNFGVIPTLTFFHIFLGLGMAVVLKNKKEMHVINVKKKKIWILAIVMIGVVTSFYFSLRNYRAEYFLGQANEALAKGNVQEAWQNYEAAVANGPHEYEYKVKFAEDIFEVTKQSDDINVVETNFAKAIELFEEAIKIGRGMPHIQANAGLVYLTLADVYRQIGQTEKSQVFFEKGIEAYKKSLEKSGNNPLFSYTLAKALEFFGRYREASEYFEKTLEIRDPFRDTYTHLAINYHKLGDVEKTLEFGEKGLAQDPSNEEIKKVLQEIEEKASEGL